jgi:hypothetical protein
MSVDDEPCDEDDPQAQLASLILSLLQKKATAQQNK